MKKLLFAIFFSFLTISLAWSQQVSSGSLSALKDTGMINIELVFSEASIHGMDEEAFSEYERDWEKDKPEIIVKFIAETALRCGNELRVGSFKKKDFTIKIMVKTISVKGDFYCDADIIDTSGNTVAQITGIKGKGGRIGSNLNLIKDGARHTGAAFGDFLKKQIKKTK